MSDGSLQRLYEDPATPLSSGEERARLQAATLVDIARASPSPLRVVDVGCGDGKATSLAIKALGSGGLPPVRMLGLDWSSTALHRAADRGVPVVRSTVAGAGLSLAPKSVDVVIMSEIIEHLVDTDAALSEAYRVLVPGGTLLISTPNLAAWYNRALLLLGVQPLFTEVSLRGIYGRPGHEVVGHLRVFTRRALTELLEANGYADVKVSGAPYHDVPRPFRPIDRLACRTPSLASILLASAHRPR